MRFCEIYKNKMADVINEQVQDTFIGLIFTRLNLTRSKIFRIAHSPNSLDLIWIKF